MLLNVCKACSGILLACSWGLKCSFGITDEAEKKYFIHPESKQNFARLQLPLEIPV